MPKKSKDKDIPILKKLAGVKQKEPKVKLVSYTMGATIPTGMYANIQPSITVEAKSMEVAERIVMAHIEALFAKYRISNSNEPVRPIAPKPTVPILPKDENNKVNVSGGSETVPPIPSHPGFTGGGEKYKPEVVLTAPFTRALAAIESCTSEAALKLVTDQIVKSVKLLEEEKVELKNIAMKKLNDITINKTA